MSLLSITQLVVTIVLLTNWFGPSGGQVCNEVGMKKFDDNLSVATAFGNPDIKFPENANQLKVWCRKTNKNLLEAEKFNKKCSKGLVKQLLSVFIYTDKKALKRYCRPSSKLSKDFMYSASCFNKHREDELKCYDIMLDRFLGAQNDVDKKKIPHLCCNYNRIMHCFHERLDSKCEEAQVDIMNDYIKTIASNAMDIICSDYSDESDKCAKLGYPPKKFANQTRTKSFIGPVVGLIGSFEEV